MRASRLLPFGLGSGRLRTVRSADSVSIVLVLTLLMEKLRQAAQVNATEDEFAFWFMLSYMLHTCKSIRHLVKNEDSRDRERVLAMFDCVGRARGKGRYRRFLGIQSTFYNKGKELRWSKGREDSQNEIWTAVEIAERKQWQDLLSSKEWRLTERHFNLCKSRISAIVTKTLSLYKDKEGHLNLNIKEEADIARGIDAYFADLNRFTSNQQRLRHIQRISFIPSVCSQVPVIVICLPEPRGLSVETFTNNRRFFMVFPLLTAALSTPPDIWCQIVARFLISSIIELTIFVASIVQVREEAGRVE
ncbi:hypothetical protein Ahy_B08g090220 [Arachis hypogaea]|uniref:Uncharacterized protein n=1 Tax=Arachis hypogaea TaxID=3818 RepID=A0A444XZS0_ARAHY|nr:hypothetical protein Ahy_B08g090220 [Arachis hypogaea]